MTKGLPLEIACVTLVCESTEAACTWTWDCSTGTCRQIPVCDSTLDLLPPRPPGIAPVSAPSIKPLHREWRPSSAKSRRKTLPSRFTIVGRGHPTPS